MKLATTSPEQSQILKPRTDRAPSYVFEGRFAYTAVYIDLLNERTGNQPHTTVAFGTSNSRRSGAEEYIGEGDKHAPHLPLSFVALVGAGGIFLGSELSKRFRNAL